jgi:AcrR family transcriptional regulator
VAVDNVNTDELTRQMIDEGARILAEQGPMGLTMRKLAAACGTSTMAVYSRFGDKPRLLAAMYREGFARLAARLRVSATDPLASLTELGRAYRLAALESRHLYGLMFSTLPPGVSLDRADDQAAGATYSTLVEAVRQAVAAGLLIGDPERIALHLWAVAHGMVSLELSGRLPPSAQETAQAYDEALTFAAMPFLSST